MFREETRPSLLEVAKEACSPPTLVSVARARLGDPQAKRLGFAVSVSPDLLLLHSLSDQIDLDGFVALRMKDVTSLDTKFPRKDFYLRALQLKGISPRLPKGIDLSSMRSLLRSAGEHFSLVVIDRELASPGECEIGRIKLTSDTTYALRWLSSEGTWERDDRSYRYSDVTQVGFDGEYENTLALVADASP